MVGFNTINKKDVIFGYTLAQMPEAYGHWRDLADRTMALTAIDDQQITMGGTARFYQHKLSRISLSAATQPQMAQHESG